MWGDSKEESMCKADEQPSLEKEAMDVLVLDCIVSKAVKSCCSSHLGYDICNGNPSWDNSYGIALSLKIS